MSDSEIVRSLRTALAERDKQISNLMRVAAERDKQVARLHQAVAERDAQYVEVLTSLWWRSTHPLRAALARFPRARVFIRRTAKLIWWSITLQLFAKYRGRQERLAHRPRFYPLTSDYALAVPFSYARPASDAPPALAVVCHMFFDEMADEFKGYLSNIPFEFDLYITTDTSEKKRRIENAFGGWKRGSLEVRVAQNRGRDIAPKLITCMDVYGKYEYVLHVHSKHSPYGDHTAGWRKYLLSTLLGSPDIVRSVFEVFKNFPDVGMIAPQHLEGIRPALGWGFNHRDAKTFSRRLGLRLDINKIIDFPSGSMFWARSAALKPLLEIGLSFDDFPVEKGQTDGTLAHVVERLYFHVCESAGFDWIKIARSDLLHNTRHRVIDVRNFEELSTFVITHRVRLSSDEHGLFASATAGTDWIGSSVPVSPRMLLFKLAHENSCYRARDFADFVRSMENLAAGRHSGIDFHEGFYLSAHPDVKQSVKDGHFPCGYIHYCIVGKKEGRIWSNGDLTKRFGIKPSVGTGLFEPVNARALPSFGPDLSGLPISEQPFLLVLFWNLQKDLFYAGYAEFFRDFASVFELFSRVVISVESDNFDSRLATRYANTIEVIHASELSKLTHRPSIIVPFNHLLFHKACDTFNDLDNTVYYCQEFEAGFFPYSADYVMAERAIAKSRNLIISTDMLRRFFESKGLLADSTTVFVTAPTIELIDAQTSKSRKLFFYFRPERFNSRNLPQILLSAAASFCERNTGYEIYMVGSVATSYSFTANGNIVFVLSKLSKEKYIELVSSCDVVVSLIYSAHPGVIAFQAAASGIPTITNVFDNRSAALLREISENLIPYDPIREDLVSLIERGVAMPKGKRSFDAHLYAGRSNTSLDSYMLEILNKRKNGDFHIVKN